MTVHPSNKNEVAWTSWLPALAHALGRSVGPVLEIGIGHFSTPFLHEYCKATDRNLVSVEADPQWLAGFVGMETHGHQFLSDWRSLVGNKWGRYSSTTLREDPPARHRSSPSCAKAASWSSTTTTGRTKRL